MTNDAGPAGGLGGRPRREPAPHRPPQQRRSHAAYGRMIEAAHRLLEERDFDSVSIRDLAAAAGCSIGSFYYRFQTKERFFEILIQDMVDRREAAVRIVFEQVPVADLPSMLARGALDNHRAHSGLLRSVIKKHLEGKRSWEPLSLMGRRITRQFQQRVAESRGTELTPLESERIDFAFVWLYGLLAQSLLELNTIYGMETAFFEEEAVKAFTQAIDRALGVGTQPGVPAKRKFPRRR
jgi:AcrR family transcriptional regulator